MEFPAKNTADEKHKNHDQYSIDIRIQILHIFCIISSSTQFSTSLYQSLICK